MMNERIRELVVESGNGQMRDGKLYPHIGSRTKEDWERFAELIIQECVEVCNGQATYDPQTLPYKPSKQFADAIKEHFGVER